MDLLRNVPNDLKLYDQWVLWRLEERSEGKPTKVPYSANGGLASVINRHSWNSFQACIDTWFRYPTVYSGIGFVLAKSDPFCFIDLDEAKSEFEHNLQRQIYDSIDSYSELSPSGKGLHIICRASVETGKKKHSVEVYTHERFMTVTGNVFQNKPIQDTQSIVYSLWEFLGGRENESNEYTHVESNKHDQEIIDRAAHAENGEMFRDLWVGDWKKYAHKWRDDSQSSADQALINIIQFYTKDHNQIMRIFRMSSLGQRVKAQRDGYLKTCIKKAFDRDFPQIDVEAIKNEVEKAILKKSKSENSNSDLPEKIGLNEISKSEPEISENQSESENVPQYVPQYVSQDLNDNHSQLPVPPGLLGELATFIHDAAVRPVPEIALAAAIGLMAGICGRCYNISGTGLNQYVLVLAQTGTGKEGSIRGINTLMNEVKKIVPTANDFIGPSVISSPQALIKKLSKHNSFVSLVGEYGSKLQLMTNPRATSADKGLLIAMLDLFNKSGQGDIFGSMAYSESDKNIESLKSPAFSLFGESTPDTFYSSIDENNIKSGFVPRFTVIEYLGDRPHINENPAKITDNYVLVDRLSKLCAQASALNSQNKVIDVQIDTVANEILKKYNLFCDNQIRGKEESSRQIWNRAHLKVLKLSALIAVGINPYMPIITSDIVNIAITYENENIKRILFKFSSNSIGSGYDVNETRQIEVLNIAIKDWLLRPWNDLKQYKSGNEELYNLRLIPHKYLIQRLGQSKAFRNDRIGTTNAIKRALKTLEESGDIIPTKDRYRYNTNQLLYAVQNINHFI